MNNWPSYSEEEIKNIRDILLSGKVNYWTGNECKNFEKEFANFVGVKFAVALMNGTVALEVALRVLGITEGDEVIVTPRSFMASVSSIVNNLATPIFADVDLDSQNITAESVKVKITPKTKAILCVHLAGWPCEMDEIVNIANEHNLYIIEDCAQAHGSSYKGSSVGSFGDISCWSFCQDKIISTGGEGGMITTNIESLYSKVLSFKDHGKDFQLVNSSTNEGGYRWLHNTFGSNYRMTEIQASLGRYQLKKLKEWTLIRNKNAQKIYSTAKKFRSLRVPIPPKYIKHAFYKCYLFINEAMLSKDWNRSRIIQEFKSRGIPCLTGSCPEIYLEKAFNDHPSKPKSRLSNAKKLGETSIMFQVHPTLTSEDIDKICSAIDDIFQIATLKND